MEYWDEQEDVVKNTGLTYSNTERVGVALYRNIRKLIHGSRLTSGQLAFQGPATSAR